MPECADNARRVRNRAALAERIESVLRERPRAHWLELFEANDFPCGPINDYAAVFADPQVQALRRGSNRRLPPSRRDRVTGVRSVRL